MSTIGIFSKLGSSGGSEHRCIEMANAITKFTPHNAIILCEDGISGKVLQKLDPSITVVRHIFKPSHKANHDALYNVDLLLIVNSDSYSFTKTEYWGGKTDHHSFEVDLSKIPQMVFLFNFVVGPAQKLRELSQKCKNVKIIVANNSFDNQIEYQSRFKRIRNIPRLILESPIDSNIIKSTKTQSTKIRLGKHSKSFGYKHNAEYSHLIHTLNATHADQVEWDFMGVPEKYVTAMQSPNVRIRQEYSISVAEYLTGIDIFIFFIDWKRFEPWARVVAEAMMAGCPVIANDRGGNRDQIRHGLNGYLCKDCDEFIEQTKYLIEHPEVVAMMRDNNIMCSQEFTLEKVVEKFLKFTRI